MDIIERLHQLSPEERAQLPARLTLADQARLRARQTVERTDHSGRPAKRGRGGKRQDLGGLYVRSSMEANLIRLLRFYGHQVEYEPADWLLQFDVPRGVREYRPDLAVRPGFCCKGADLELWEAKGWMDPRSKTALARITRFHGDRIQVLYDPRFWDRRRVPLLVVDWPMYRDIVRGADSIVPGWE